MNGSRKLVAWVGLAVLVVVAHVAGIADVDGQKPGEPVAGSTDEPRLDTQLDIQRPDRIPAVVYPYQSATIGTEVRGVVDLMTIKEGDQVEGGSAIAEISKARYAAIVGEFKGNYDAVVKSLDRAREELTIQEQLYDRRSTTYDDLSKARSQVEILEARQHEAQHKLKQAELNLTACVVKAPFSGNISVLYHEPYEMVDNLEKLFGIIDTSKVYARVNWPESRLSDLSIGKNAVFNYEGKTYEGGIDKISSLIDPASRTKRVHILIDNRDGRLQVGMSGSVGLSQSKKVSRQTAVPE